MSKIPKGTDTMIGRKGTPLSFDATAIQTNVPSTSGTYAIFKGLDTCVYVGQSADLKASLLQHLAGDNPCILQNQPTSFQFVVEPALQRVQHQQRLFGELNPICT